MKIAVDAMGGDFAPQNIVEGAVLAAREYGVPVLLVGDEKIVRAGSWRNIPEAIPFP